MGFFMYYYFFLLSRFLNLVIPPLLHRWRFPFLRQDIRRWSGENHHEACLFTKGKKTFRSFNTVHGCPEGCFHHCFRFVLLFVGFLQGVLQFVVLLLRMFLRTVYLGNGLERGVVILGYNDAPRVLFVWVHFFFGSGW